MLVESASAPGTLDLWLPVLAVAGPGGRSTRHSHHALHVVIGLDRPLRVRAGRGWKEAAGVITPADIPHEIDAREQTTLLVFLDPESDIGAAVSDALASRIRVLTGEACARLTAAPPAIMGEGRTAWVEALGACLGTGGIPPRRIHPKVRKAVRLLRQTQGNVSLDELAQQVALSPGRLMHAFTESVGIPLRPYLAWLRLQRAVVAMSGGRTLTEAAHEAGFSDSAHMSRAFRRMFGTPASVIRSRQPVRSSGARPPDA